MKRNEYKNFKSIVEQSNENDPVWYAGYLWIDLTAAQADDMKKLLKVHPSVIRTEAGLQLPSGITIRV